ncbi:ImmA/IrrE family metallo-endopeptidase [Pediococcus acidilactici]|uniref:ImmA/IrrE family metallo-endopeptidase n=1 Tax=Pediococcus acidilactici TaxID=1254 RepID=UPI00232C65E4|nr:ImmA/IrrE family metallo-endopeptidase [Pediococcus acidilactici]MDB8867647.1 ImmA/IrrE family metallo-endopeptidase [Pediococcus acidilactici]
MDDLIAYLCNYAFDHGIGYELDAQDFEPDDSPFSSTEESRVFINMNWRKQSEIPFQFAHEISHILNGDLGSNSYSANSLYSKEEFAANKRATKILLEYCDLHRFEWNNVINFMNSFSIPMRAKDAVKAGFKEYIGKPYSTNCCEI